MITSMSSEEAVVVVVVVVVPANEEAVQHEGRGGATGTPGLKPNDAVVVVVSCSGREALLVVDSSALNLFFVGVTTKSPNVAVRGIGRPRALTGT